MIFGRKLTHKLKVFLVKDHDCLIFPYFLQHIFQGLLVRLTLLTVLFISLTAPPPRPKSPEIPPELANQEGLCRNCGQWSTNLKKCDSCGKNVYKMKPIKYRMKGTKSATVLFNKKQGMVETQNPSSSPGVDTVKVVSEKKGGITITTNKFYNSVITNQLEPYKSFVKISHRGGNRGKRGRGRGRGGRAVYKEPGKCVAT